MPIENPTREEIGKILKDSKKIAVVGLSDNPDRTSYMAVSYTHLTLPTMAVV